MKKLFLPLTIVATLAIFVGGVIFFSKENKSEPLPLPSTYELFWGDGCPHCEKVEEFLGSWEGKDKVQIDRKEIWKNRQNAALMRTRATSCGLSLVNLGVPLLFTPEGKCLGGDESIIEFFKGLEL